MIEREFFDWKGNKLDVKITEKVSPARRHIPNDH